MDEKKSRLKEAFNGAVREVKNPTNLLNSVALSGIIGVACLITGAFPVGPAILGALIGTTGSDAYKGARKALKRHN